MGFGDLEIEERRPRTWNEPKIKRLSFARNRRHVLDDRTFDRNRTRNRSRRDADDWDPVPLSSQQRRGNHAQRDQVQQWDNQRLDTQFRFAKQENEHQAIMNRQEMEFQDMKQRQRFLQAQQLQQFILQGQQFRPPMGHFQEHGMQQHGQQGQQQHVGQQRQIPIPPQHGVRGGGHGGPDNRIQALGPTGGGGRQHGGPQRERIDENSDDDSDEHEPRGHQRGGHNDNRPQRGGRQRGRQHNDYNFGRGGGHGGRGRQGGRFEHGDSDDDIVAMESDSDSDDDDFGRHSPRRLGGGHGQRLPDIYFRPRSHSRGRRHQSRNQSRRRTSRRRTRPLYSDDSDSDDAYETHVRFARPSRSRAPLRRARSESRHYAYDSDDSFVGLNRRPRLRRLRSKSRGPRLPYFIR